VTAYYGGIGEKDVIGIAEINISLYFGEKNKDVKINLTGQKYPNTSCEFVSSICDPKEILEDYNETDSINLTTMNDEDGNKSDISFDGLLQNTSGLSTTPRNKSSNLDVSNSDLVKPK